MKKLIATMIAIAACCALASCGQSKVADEAKFYDEQLGWTFPVPLGWEEQDEFEVESVRKSGIKFSKENLGNINLTNEILDYTRPVFYLAFDDDNSFMSEADPYDERTSGPYAFKQQASLQRHREALDYVATNNNGVTRHQEGKLRIDEVPFSTITTELLRQDEQKVILTSGLMLGLVGDTELLILYGCTSKPRCKEIHGAIVNSKFDKR